VNTSIERVKQIFTDYHRFDDGLILSFEYYYVPDHPLAAQMIFYARNQRLAGNIWRKVKVVVKDVQEIRAQVNGNQINSICSGVKLLNFGDLWCVDIDSTYSLDKDPSSLEEVRRDGECYVIGRDVEAYEVID
jgi:hypothetical protein